MSSIADGTVALVGHHNVGKSLIFQRLTGSRVTVANYPGTTVEVARSTGPSTLGGSLLDTPGVITFPTRIEDERATSRALLEEPLRAIVQVGDAKNVRRSLLLTLQLIEIQLPMLLVLNMTDEADLRGVRVEHYKLSEQLGIPVVPTVAIRGEGLDELGQALAESSAPAPRLHYAGSIENALCDIVPLMPASSLSSRGLALFWLSGDPEAEYWLRRSLDQAIWQHLEARRVAFEVELGQSASAAILATRLAYVEHLAGAVLLDSGAQSNDFAARLGRLSVHPIWGLPMLAGVLAAVYLFVGHFGAGTLVDLLGVKLFGEILNPWIIQTVETLSPIPFLTEFLVGPYGLWTMGMTYALALILPIVATFFLAFGVLEDTGYLPRLSVISNRLFSRIGLNGKAMLPMVLGLGCVTMATITTRVLESNRASFPGRRPAVPAAVQAGMGPMNSTCPLCGHALDATGCDSCPLGSNCPMVCCPACGYTTVDTDKTSVGKLAVSLTANGVPAQNTSQLPTLAEAPKGASIRVVAVENTIGSRPQQMQAYGLAPGQVVQILQQIRSLSYALITPSSHSRVIWREKC